MPSVVVVELPPWNSAPQHLHHSNIVLTIFMPSLLVLSLLIILVFLIFFICIVLVCHECLQRLLYFLLFLALCYCMWVLAECNNVHYQFWAYELVSSMSVCIYVQSCCELRETHQVLFCFLVIYFTCWTSCLRYQHTLQGGAVAWTSSPSAVSVQWCIAAMSGYHFFLFSSPSRLMLAPWGSSIVLLLLLVLPVSSIKDGAGAGRYPKMVSSSL